MTIDKILYELIRASELKQVRITKAIQHEFNFYVDNCLDSEEQTTCHILYPTADVPIAISRKDHEASQRQAKLKAEQEFDRKKAQVGRENFEEIKANHGLNPTIAAALTELAEKIGMEEIRKALKNTTKPKI